jgi:hypothetical protein
VEVFEALKRLQRMKPACRGGHPLPDEIAEISRDGFSESSSLTRPVPDGGLRGFMPS